MKHAKKFASLLLALVMVFALATTAFAAENTTISAPDGSTRAYDVYQIFTGDLHEGVLSNSGARTAPAPKELLSIRPLWTLWPLWPL